MARTERVLGSMIAIAMSVVLSCLLAAGAAFAISPHAAGSIVQDEAMALNVQAKKKAGWATAKAGTFYYKKGKPVIGLQKIKGSYYYFNAKGVMQTSDVKAGGALFYVGPDGKVMGAKYDGKYYYSTMKPMTGTDAYDFETDQQARTIVAHISDKNDGKSEKLWKAFKWVVNKSYAIHQDFNPRQANWTAIYARHHFDNRGGDCHADGAAFAYLAAAIGYPADVCIDSWGVGYAPSHCWAMIGNAVYDPLFYESKSTMYYGATSGTYETSPTARFRVPQFKAANNKKGKVSLDLVNAGSMGLKKVNGKYYYYKNGKKVKNAWKTIDGKRYYFTKNGAAATLSTKVKGAYYVFGSNGVLQQGAKSGVRVVSLGKERYLVDKAGRAHAGWSASGARFAMRNGKCLRNAWKTIDGKRYHFGNDGVRATGSAKVAGEYYVFGADGALLKGIPGQETTIVSLGGEFYRIDADGKARAGWSQDGAQRFGVTGLLLTGVWYLDAAFYASDAEGNYLQEATAAINEAASGYDVRNKPASDLRSALEAAGAVPKNTVYSASCDIAGDDGLWEYDHFTVMTARPSAAGSVEYIRSITAL